MWFPKALRARKSRSCKASAGPKRHRPRLEALEDRSLPSAGQLDPTFGTGGLVATAVSPNGSQANSLAIQPDGKLVAVGYAFNITGGQLAQDFALARYSTNGSLDGAFGSGGLVTTSLVKGYDRANAVVLQSDGKVLVGGTANLDASPWIANQNYAFALARYNANGTLDTTFGGKGSKGTITTEVASGATQEEITGLALQADGKIVVVGSSNGNLALVRYNANGTLDATFGSGGKRLLDVGGFEEARGAVLQADGKIVVAGRTTVSDPGGDILLVRFNANGTLDSSFGNGGVVITDIAQPGVGPRENWASAVALQGGRIVVAGDYSQEVWPGASQGRFLVAGYTAAGALDTTFGTDHNGDTIPDGYTLTAVPQGTADAYALAIDPAGGKIVVAGRGISPDSADPALPEWDWDYAVARYNPDGSPDTPFGTGGVTVTDASGTDSETFRAVAIQADGKVVGAGYAVNPATGRSQFGLARYLGDGGASAASSSSLSSALGVQDEIQAKLLLASALTDGLAASHANALLDQHAGPTTLLILTDRAWPAGLDAYPASKAGTPALAGSAGRAAAAGEAGLLDDAVWIDLMLGQIG